MVFRVYHVIDKLVVVNGVDYKAMANPDCFA